MKRILYLPRRAEWGHSNLFPAVSLHPFWDPYQWPTAVSTIASML